MDQIRQQVAHARRRLWVELFLKRLVRCWFVALSAAAAAIAIPKLVAIESLPLNWAGWCLAGAIILGAAAALVWTSFRGRTDLEAAMEIDRRFELKERVASSLSLPADAVDTPAGKALLADAQRAISRLEINERFRIQLGRAAWLPLGPALLAVLVIALFNDRATSGLDPHSDSLSKQTLDNTTQTLRKKLEEQKKAAKEKGLQDAEELMLQLQKDAEKLAEKKDVDRKQALVDLSDLSKQLAERREKLGGDEELRKQLAGMKDSEKGPADKMVDAMKNGDWSKAKQELDKLKDQIKDGKLDAEGQKQVQKQLDQIKQKLEQAAAEHKQAIADLKKQIDEQKRQGNLDQAGKLQQKLDQMAQQQNKMQQLSQLAQKMGQAQQSLKQGDGKAAAKAMEQMAKQLEDMQQQMAEAQMLDATMAQLEEAKDAMNCPLCNGKGCAACQGGAGKKPNPNAPPGDGMGQGVGKGNRPEEKNDVAYRDSQVKQDARKGAAVIAGEAEGPNIRGEVREAIKQEMDSQGSEPADPLVIETLPKTQRENAEDYFNRLREGE